ncbi:hypothetical protein [Schlesneria paludicola]|uniref:hypothetical protein n=1 Tax=Schlesneria paludicola TaxID=360056 RepID=UPI00029AA94C|nr:hypothetical protein [Schlesneria paludicola]
MAVSETASDFQLPHGLLDKLRSVRSPIAEREARLQRIEADAKHDADCARARLVELAELTRQERIRHIQRDPGADLKTLDDRMRQQQELLRLAELKIDSVARDRSIGVPIDAWTEVVEQFRIELDQAAEAERVALVSLGNARRIRYSIADHLRKLGCPAVIAIR